MPKANTTAVENEAWFREEECPTCGILFVDHDIDACLECGRYFSWCTVQRLFDQHPELNRRSQLCGKCLRVQIVEDPVS